MKPPSSIGVTLRDEANSLLLCEEDEADECAEGRITPVAAAVADGYWADVMVGSSTVCGD